MGPIEICSAHFAHRNFTPDGATCRRTKQVPQQTVDACPKKAKMGFGIRSIICLLDQRQVN